MDPVVLFDVRTDDSHAGYIAMVNRSLDGVPENPYLDRFGHVGTPGWWACLDHGDLATKVRAGRVSFVGVRPDSFAGEDEDVVEFDCDGKPIAYDRVDHWATYPIRIGDRIRVLRTTVEVPTPTGPICCIVDLRAEWFPMAGGSVDQVGVEGRGQNPP